jgi:hypothetical protein
MNVQELIDLAAQQDPTARIVDEDGDEMTFDLSASGPGQVTLSSEIFSNMDEDSDLDDEDLTSEDLAEL